MISFTCLISPAKTSSTLLDRYGETGDSYFVPDFSGNIFSSSLSRMILAVSLL